MDTKLKNVSYLRCHTYNAFGKLWGGTLATYSFVALETKFAGFVLSAVCSYLTVSTLLGFGFLGAVDSERGLAIVAFLLDLSTM